MFKVIYLIAVFIGTFAVETVGQKLSGVTYELFDTKSDSLHLRIKYIPDNYINGKDTVYAIVYVNQLNEEEPRAIEIPVQIENDYLVGDLVIKSTFLSVMVVFMNSKGKISNNNGVGYYYMRSKNGVILQGARASIAYMYSGAWDANKYYKITAQRDLARSLYEDEFKLYPESKRHYYRYYLSSLRTTSDQEKEKYHRELKDFSTYTDLTEWELLFLSEVYERGKDSINAKLFRSTQLAAGLPKSIRWVCNGHLLVR